VRISVVVPFVNLTGGIRVLLDYANQLQGAGHDVTVIYPLWPYRFHFTRRDQFNEYRKHVGSEPRVEWLDLRCRLLRVPLVSNVFMPAADVIVAASWPVAHDVARLDRSRGRKVQIVFHHESGTGPENRIAATYALPFYRIACCQSIKQSIERQFSSAIHDVVPAGIDASRFFQDGMPEQNTVLMLYHNDPRKGAADGIDALERLRRRHPTLRVRMCGTVAPSHLPDWISFEMHPTDAALRRLYSTSTVFLYPSRYEGFGLPPLEAMACACPVVTTTAGAVSEFAADRCNALLVQPNDVSGMTVALEELLSNGNLRQALSAAGSITADRYALGRTAPLFEAALRRAMDAPSNA
jgi:glycosyltransferase involved in cell wall biosynthesis